MNTEQQYANLHTGKSVAFRSKTQRYWTGANAATTLTALRTTRSTGPPRRMSPHNDAAIINENLRPRVAPPTGESTNRQRRTTSHLPRSRDNSGSRRTYRHGGKTQCFRYTGIWLRRSRIQSPHRREGRGEGLYWAARVRAAACHASRVPNAMHGRKRMHRIVCSRVSWNGARTLLTGPAAAVRPVV